jgi:hypothetical protein
MKKFLLAAISTGLLISCTLGQAQLSLPFTNNIIQKFSFDFAVAASANTIIFIKEVDRGYEASFRNADSLQSLKRIDISGATNINYCKYNPVALSPGGKLLAIGNSKVSDTPSDYVDVVDLSVNKNILSFEANCNGIVFLDNDRLYTSSGVVRPMQGTQDDSNIPSMTVMHRVDNYLISLDGSVYNTETNTFNLKSVGQVRGPLFQDLMLILNREGNYQIFNWKTGVVVSEFKIDIEDYFIGLLDLGRLVIANDSGIYIYSIADRSARLFTKAVSIPETPRFGPAGIMLDPLHKRLFIEGGTVVNLK